jgi:hypothetical protein
MRTSLGWRDYNALLSSIYETVKAVWEERFTHTWLLVTARG